MSDFATMPFVGWRYIENFASVTNPRDWFRIMPVGKFSRFGRRVQVTDPMLQEMVGNFRIIPPTALPVNREHKSELGKVGNITALQHRPGDGLYAMIDWLPDGWDLLSAGAFQYFSPEIVWNTQEWDGATGKNILVGLALTNEPYFGSATALYSVRDLDDTPSVKGEIEMSATDTLTEGLTNFFAQFASKPVDPVTAPPPVVADDMSAENAALKAEVLALKASETAAKLAVRKAAFATRLPDMPQIVEHLAAMADETLAETLAVEFAALSTQVKTAGLFTEKGTSGGGGAVMTPAEQFNALVESAKAKGANPADALRGVAKEHPELYQASIRDSAAQNKGG